MFIAFEGPDNTGKSTSAANLASDGKPFYNATKEGHAERAAFSDRVQEPDLVMTYDRIDWFSHMVYRLALPDREWNDARARTVFAMPDTHLVVKLHRPDLANFTAEEVVDTPISQVNPLYYYFADFLMDLNRVRNYSLFKSISMVEVVNDPRDGSFSQSLVAFDSAAFSGDRISQLTLSRLVHTDEDLLTHLRSVDQHVA